MKKIVFLFLILSASIFSFSCNKKGKSSRVDLFSYVPADASLVMSLNTGQLREKIDWDYLNNSPAITIFKIALKDNIFSKYIFDGDATGVNFGGHIVIYSVIDSTKSEGKIYAIMPLLDKEKFETSIKELTKTETFTKNKEYTSCAGQGMLAGWTEDIVLMVITPDEQAEGSFLSAELDSAFDVKKPMPLDSKVFADFRKKNADINIWGDPKSIMKSMPVDLSRNPFKDTEGIYGLTFNKGDITIDFDAYPKDEKGKEILSKLMNRLPENNMIQHLPDAYTMLVQLSAEPTNVIDYAEEVTGKDVMEKLKNEIDSSLSKDDIAALVSKLEGDILISLGRINTENPSFVLTASVSGENLIESMSVLAKNHIIYKNGDMTILTKGNDTIYAAEKNKLIAIASSASAVEQALDGRSSPQKISSEVSNAIQKNPFVFYLDAAKMFENFSDPEMGMITNIVGNMFQDAIIIAEPLKDDKVYGVMKINLTNKDDYSINVMLKTLLESSGTLFN